MFVGGFERTSNSTTSGSSGAMCGQQLGQRHIRQLRFNSRRKTRRLRLLLLLLLLAVLCLLLLSLSLLLLLGCSFGGCGSNGGGCGAASRATAHQRHIRLAVRVVAVTLIMPLTLDWRRCITLLWQAHVTLCGGAAAGWLLLLLQGIHTSILCHFTSLTTSICHDNIFFLCCA